MRRRAFIALLGGAVSVWPSVVRAQSSVLPVVTSINARSADGSAALAAEFRKGLRQAGFADGTDVVVEYHWLDGHYEELSAIINDAVRRTVAVIATPGNSPGAIAAKAATETIPIVFGVAEDPVALGLVKSLAQPHTNATGINFFASEIDGKRLGLMHELLPKAARFAVLVNPANAATAEATSKALREVTPGLGLELLFFAPVRRLRSMRRLRPLPVRERTPFSSPLTLFLRAGARSLPRSLRVTDFPLVARFIQIAG
jgi:putative tryptophan/tyrosine transport system substrate-binding protein